MPGDDPYIEAQTVHYWATKDVEVYLNSPVCVGLRAETESERVVVVPASSVRVGLPDARVTKVCIAD